MFKKNEVIEYLTLPSTVTTQKRFWNQFLALRKEQKYKFLESILNEHRKYFEKLGLQL